MTGRLRGTWQRLVLLVVVLIATEARSAATPALDMPRATAASEQIAARVRRIEGLEDVSVSVRAGVARLDGVVVDAHARDLAAQVVAQQPGISAVENHVQLSTRLADRFQAAVRQVGTKLVQLLAATPLFAVALTIVLLAWWIGRLLASRVHLARLRRHNPYVDSLLARLLQWVLLLVGVLLALDLLDATTLVGAVLGSAGVVGLVLGFAFKDIAENYVAGILLSLRRPFAPGDQLLIDKYEGKVVALTSRATLLMTLDGNQLSLPNSLVFKSVVLNYTANPRRRFDFTIPIARSASIRDSQQAALAELARIDAILADPAPSWQVEEFGDAWIRLQFFGWIDQHQSDLAKVRSEAIRAVKAAFERLEAQRMPATATEPPQPPPVEPPHDASAPCDTSVNHDIDAQLDEGRQAIEERDLL